MDPILIKNSIKGERRSQNKLYEISYKRVRPLCIYFLEDPSMLEEVMQAAFIKLFSKLDQFSPERGEFDKWANSIFVTAAQDANRYRNTKRYMLSQSRDFREFWDSGYEPAYTESVLDKLYLQDLISFIQRSQLDDGFKTVFLLKVAEGLTHEEIGKLLNIPQGTSKTRYKAAVRDLYDIIVNGSNPRNKKPKKVITTKVDKVKLELYLKNIDRVLTKPDKEVSLKVKVLHLQHKFNNNHQKNPEGFSEILNDSFSKYLLHA